MIPAVILIRGGLILAANWRTFHMVESPGSSKAGRKDDLFVFSPDSPLRFNFLGYAIAMGGDTGVTEVHYGDR